MMSGSFGTSYTIEVDANKEYEYNSDYYVNLIDAYDFKWRQIKQRKGNILDESTNTACQKEHAYNLIMLIDQKATISCNINLEDQKEIKFTFEQIRTITAAKNEKQRIQREENAKWDCINAYNKWWGYYKLSQGWDGVNKYGYEHTTHKVDGREVKILYMDDGRVVMRFEDTDRDVPGGIGKWECDSEGTGYRIKWNNGQVAVFSKRKDIK